MSQPESIEIANEAGKNDSQTVTIFRTEGYDRVMGRGSRVNDTTTLSP
jgi:hypothetical protein